MSLLGASMARRSLALLVTLAIVGGCIGAQPEDEPAPEAPDAGASESMGGCTPPTVEPTGPSGGQSGVTNQPGSFTYGGQAAAKTATEVFLWENPSKAAQVTFGGQSGVGSFTITIQDHCGVQVYRKESTGAAQQAGGVEPTQDGTGGVWILTFEFVVYTGQMGITITSA